MSQSGGDRDSTSLPPPSPPPPSPFPALAPLPRPQESRPIAGLFIEHQGQNYSKKVGSLDQKRNFLPWELSRFDGV